MNNPESDATIGHRRSTKYVERENMSVCLLCFTFNMFLLLSILFFVYLLFSKIQLDVFTFLANQASGKNRWFFENVRDSSIHCTLLDFLIT